MLRKEYQHYTEHKKQEMIENARKEPKESNRICEIEEAEALRQNSSSHSNNKKQDKEQEQNR
jgi:hypothetical protein